MGQTIKNNMHRQDRQSMTEEVGKVPEPFTIFKNDKKVSVPWPFKIETDWLYPITWKIVAPVGIAVAIATAGGAYYLWQNWSNLQEDFPNLRSYSDSVFGNIGDEKNDYDIKLN